MTATERWQAIEEAARALVRVAPGSNTPRATRDTPIAMPIGMAVTQAAMNALKTRNIDQPKCVASGASTSWPIADS